jgi:phosphoglycerate dehydrogenase-like enzyme
MGLIDGRRLAAMKPSAFLINLARGPITEEQALYRALRDGIIGGAALDTWWRYPSDDDPPQGQFTTGTSPSACRHVP